MLDILKIPITLQMVCELYVAGRDLPQTKTEIMESIFHFSFERAMKKSNVTWSGDEICKMMYNLGKLSWKYLRKESRQLLLDEV